VTVASVGLGSMPYGRQSANRVHHNFQHIRGIGSNGNAIDLARDSSATWKADAEVVICDRLPLEEYPQTLERFAASLGGKIQEIP